MGQIAHNNTREFIKMSHDHVSIFIVSNSHDLIHKALSVRVHLDDFDVFNDFYQNIRSFITVLPDLFRKILCKLIDIVDAKAC